MARLRSRVAPWYAGEASTHSHYGPHETDAARENPMLAQLLGEKTARTLLSEDTFRSAAESRLKIACRYVRKEAREEVEKYGGSAFIRSGSDLVQQGNTPQSIKNAFWRGFDWQIERAFRCACDPGKARKDLDGLRRRNRKGR